MTNTVVIETGTGKVIAKRETQPVVVESNQPKTVVTGIMGPAGARTFSEMADVDLSNLPDGSVLVYNQTNNKWASTTLLNKQTVDCGQF